jgi:hypothetical protein
MRYTVHLFEYPHHHLNRLKILDATDVGGCSAMDVLDLWSDNSGLKEGDWNPKGLSGYHPVRVSSQTQLVGHLAGEIGFVLVPAQLGPFTMPGTL